MLTAAAVAATAANRWLLAGIASAIAVLGLAAYARAKSKENSSRRGTRRRAGAMIALGPVIGLVVAPELSDLTVVVALGALLLAVVGVAIERSEHTDGLAATAAAVAALVAVLAGARLAPTGIEAFDVVGAFLFV